MTATTNMQFILVQPGDNVNAGAALNTNMQNLDVYLSGWQVLNVREPVYGAVGNGVADDTAAIQAALNAAGALAASNGGAVVVIPPGRYLIAAATRMNVMTGVTIWAYGAYLFKGGVPSSGILANFIAGIDSFAGYTGNSHIKILGGIWDGKGQNAATNAGYDIIDFNHCTDIEVRDVTVRNGCSDHALEFNSTDGGIAVNCRFEGFRDATAGLTRQFSEAIQIDCAESGSASIPLYDGTHSRNITVLGCYMGPAVDGSGLGSYGKLVGSHTTAAGQAYNRIVIVANIVQGSLDDGIQAYNWVDSVIADNTIIGAGVVGIHATVPDPSVAGFSVLGPGISITGNTISGPASHGIEVFGYTTTACPADVAISGNVIRNAGANGIIAQVVAGGVNISGNIVDVSGSNSINVTAVQYPVISGNWANAPTTNYCIFLGQVTSPSTISTTDALVADNVCLLGAAATAGIRLSTGTTKTLVTGNTVRKAGGSQTIAVSCAGGAGTTCTVDGNDLTGFGDATATITVSSGTIQKTFPATTNIGRNLG